MTISEHPQIGRVHFRVIITVDGLLLMTKIHVTEEINEIELMIFDNKFELQSTGKYYCRI